MLSEFIKRRLQQLNPAGAGLVSKVNGDAYVVYTVRLADQKFTRVISILDPNFVLHFEGVLDTQAAAELTAAEFAKVI